MERYDEERKSGGASYPGTAFAGTGPSHGKDRPAKCQKGGGNRTDRYGRKLAEQVEGVGETRVFITCQSSSRKIVEKDETETVYEKDAKGTQQPYVASEEYPRVTGVLIVAKGGGNPVVVGNIQAAVEALFQVEPHKIKVMKMN